MSGPERPTICEQFIGLLRLPYALGCAIATLPLVIATLLVTPNPTNQLPYVGPFLYALGVYSYYAPRYMRSKLLRTEESLASLLPRGETDFHEIFRSVSLSRPQLVFILAITLFPFGRFWGDPRFNVSPGLYLLAFGYSALLVVGIGSAFWVYFTSLLGIHKMGRLTIQFVPSYRDRTLGLRPVGSLALSLATSFFAFAAFASPLTLLAFDPFSWAFQAIVILFGVAMFFLPMRRLHQRMVEQKKLEKEKLDRELEEVFSRPGPDSQDDTKRILRLDIMKRELAATGTWPYDVSILSKLTVISMSLVAALLSRIIAALLGI